MSQDKERQTLRVGFCIAQISVSNARSVIVPDLLTVLDLLLVITGKKDKRCLRLDSA